jgi:hypothetical protein
MENDSSNNYSGNVFTELLPSNDGRIHRHASNRSSIVAAVTCLPNRKKGYISPTRCLATIEDTYTSTQTDERDS